MGRRRPFTVRAPLSVLVVAVLVVFGGNEVAAAHPGLAWSSPALIDTAGARNSVGIAALSCPAVSLCVGFDGLGKLVFSRHPAILGSWRTARLSSTRGLYPVGVSCPSVSACVGLATTYLGAGRLVVSTAPARGARTWRVERLAAAVNPNAIACPNPALCVAVEADGNVVSSSDPLRAPGTWHVAHVDSSQSAIGKAQLLGISCPSTALCVAVDDAGNIVSSTNPTGGPSAWKLVHVFSASLGRANVSCPSVRACVAASGGRILTSTDPSGGRSAWRVTSVAVDDLASAISCPSAAMCVANSAGGGGIVTSSSLAGGSGTWAHRQVDGTNTVDVISCPSVTLCVIADEDGDIVIGSSTRRRIDVPVVIVRTEATLRTKRHGSTTTIDFGLAVACPRRGSLCTVDGAASATDFPANRQIGLGRVHFTIQAGARREIVLTLSRAGQRLLRKSQGFLEGDLYFIARADHARAVANDLPFTVEPPLP